MNQRKRGKKKNKKGPAGTDQSDREGLENAGARNGGHTKLEENRAWKGTASSSRQDPSRTQQGPRLTTFHVSPEGVLTLRARPPTEGEFVDCFQKTKLAINLLVSQPYPVLGVWVGYHTGPYSHTCSLSPAGSSHPQAKLQKHIQNPSAAELVHFLFGPLDLVTGAGTGWGQEQLSDTGWFWGWRKQVPTFAYSNSGFPGSHSPSLRASL